MTTVQLNAKKLEIIGLLMNMDDEKKVTRMLSIARKGDEETLERIPGLAYTREERLAAIKRAEEDIAAGRTITHEAMGKMIASW
jgi:predicted transcriptional regulator